MNVKLITIAVTCLGAGALAALLLTTADDRGLRAPAGQSGSLGTTGKALIGGPFSLVDATGKRVTEKDFAGRYMLVFFGFTHCPDICPSGLTVISTALDMLGKDAEPITPLFVTIDPERDTPAKMGEYAKSFHPRLVALSGSKEDVAAIVKAYRVFAKKVPDDRDPASYTMDHSSIAYLMGRDGSYLAIFPDLTKPDQLAAGLRKALAQR